MEKAGGGGDDAGAAGGSSAGGEEAQLRGGETVFYKVRGEHCRGFHGGVGFDCPTLAQLDQQVPGADQRSTSSVMSIGDNVVVV